MVTLLYFAIFAGLFFLMMRFGCGAHVMGHGAHGEKGEHGGHGGQGTREAAEAERAPPETDIDPVCRMSVRTDTAKSSVYRGTAYYFCSAEHRDAFEAEPERYLGAKGGTEAKSMEHRHG